MRRPLAALLALLLSLPLAAQSQERVTLGWGRLLTNDAIGDGRDRWRTGSYALSRVRGPNWRGSLPTSPGEILEFRMRMETIAPADLVAPVASDRRYVGALSFGMHTHFDMAGFETSIGADAVIVGPQTQISSLHGDLHDLLGLPNPTVFGAQISNKVLPTLTGEVGRTLNFGAAQVRPFVEGQVGAETLIRVGGDMTVGHFAKGALILRDVSTGQPMRVARGDRTDGVSLTMGGDIAQVFDSNYFIGADPNTVSDQRSRLRAGLHWQGGESEAFYGLTWLGREFEEQADDQVVGSINLRVKF